MRKALLVYGLTLGVALLTATQPSGAQQPQQPPKPQEPKQEPQSPETPQQPALESLSLGPSPEEMAAAQRLLEVTDPQQRLAVVESFLSQYPNSQFRSRAYLAGAEAYRMQGNFEKTVEYAENAKQLAPGDPFAMILMADALVEGARPGQSDYAQKLTRAEENARQALELIPTTFAPERRRPEVPEEQYTAQKNYVEAQPRATLGFVYIRRGDFARAEEELKKATELNSMRPNAVDFMRLGYAQARQGQWSAAKAALERCIEIGGAVAVNARQLLDEVEKNLAAQPKPESPPQQPPPPERPPER